MSIVKSPISMAVLVVFFYVLVTWSLYHQWESNVLEFFRASNALSDNEFDTSLADIARLSEGAPQQSVLLKVLLFPIPTIVAATGNGLITFWSVLVQGLLLGGLVYLTIKARLIKKG